MRTKTYAAILVLLLVTGISAFSQSIFEDAVVIRSFYKPEFGKIDYNDTNKVRLMAVLLKYTSNKKLINSAGFNAHFDTVENNEFLKDLFDETDVSAAENEVPAKPAGSSFSGVASTNVAVIADALARFIVERTKAELTTTFFERFKKELDKNDELRVLFPSTYLSLKAIDDEIYNYTAYLGLLHAAFEKDMQGIFQNVQKLWELKKYQDVFRQHPEFELVIKNAIALTESLVNGAHPGDILDELSQTTFVSSDPAITNYRNTLRLFNLASQSFRSTVPERYWMQADSVSLLYNDFILQKIYFGLLLQTARHQPPIVFTSGSNTVNITDKLIAMGKSHTHDSLQVYVRFFQGMVADGERIDRQIKLIKKHKNLSDSVNYEDYSQLLSSFTDFFNEAVNLEKLPYLHIDIPNGYGTFIYVTHLCNDLYVSVAQKEYRLAVLNAVLIIDTINNSLPDPAAFNGNSAKYMKFGMLAANITLAQNSEELSEAIESMALPPGSARIKREALFNVSLNAYCGLYLGKENIEGLNDSKLFNSFGVTAPIGFAVSAGRIFKCHSSASLFLSVIDIGALAAYRFDNDSVETVPDIELQNIFSPGVFFSYGFPKVPLSLNIGWQIGPLLREVTQTANTYSDSYTRFSVSLCVDIPMLNIYTGTK